MEESQAQYTILRANHQNIHLLSQLFFEAKGINIPTTYLKAKFNTDYTGKTYFAHFALAEDGSPAAFFCLFPCFVEIDGVKLLAGQSADIITHPNHQRRGLFGKLGGITEDLAQKEGMNILFAFPNDNSFPGFFRSLSWHHIGNFQVFTFKTPSIPVFRILHKLKLGRLYKLYSSIILRKSELPNADFKSSNNASNLNSCFRDAAYFQYKHYNPSFMITWKGIRIWAKIEAQLIIGDIEKNEHFSTNEVILKISSLCKKLGLDQFTFEISEQSYWYSQLIKIQPPTIGVPIVYKNLVDPNQSLPLAFMSGDADVF